jgi:hypothetical protein
MKGGTNMGGSLAIGFISLVLMIGVILLIREIVMWYWKINDIVYQLEQQSKLLERISEQLKSK